jgi:DNA-3-methyladenine glycosylase
MASRDGDFAKMTPSRGRAPKPLPRAFYARPTATVARELVGKVLMHDTPEGRTSGRIVEVEAYLGLDDPASHAFRGPTPRAAIMFGEGGFSYVYLSYGMHHCLNVVAHAPDASGAVLIRALDPLEGLELMAARRFGPFHDVPGSPSPKDRRIQEYASGPGRLCQALGVNRTHNGLDLQRSPLRVLDDHAAVGAIAASPRIGISQARDLALRYYVRGHACVSGSGALNRGGRIVEEG